MKSIESIHRAVVGANEHIKELTVLQDEVKRLQKQLDETQALLDKEMKDHFRTHQLALHLKEQLKEATKCINWVIDTFQKGLEHESDVVGCCELSLERIEVLKQKDARKMVKKRIVVMSNMKCPVCKTGNVEQGKYDKEYFCDNEFCPSYDETDSSTYNILIRTRKALDMAKDAIDVMRLSQADCN